MSDAPVFPTTYIKHHHVTGEPYTWYDPGMSLRDYFAGQALNAIFIKIDTHDRFDIIASESYRLADAMLAEREKNR